MKYQAKLKLLIPFILLGQLLLITSMLPVESVINPASIPDQNQTPAQLSSTTQALKDLMIDPQTTYNYNWLSSQSWCNGSGTKSDPYVISDISFTGESSDYCFTVKNSDAWIIIKDCLFSDGKQGLHVESSHNIIIKNCIFGEDLSYGINIDASQDISLEDNYFSKHSVAGIFTSSSEELNISKNRAMDCKYGIYLKHCSEMRVSFNFCNFSTSSGIEFYDCNGMNATQNTFNNNTRDGMLIWNSNENILDNNIINGNGEFGIRLYASHDNTVSNNTLLFNKQANVTELEGSSGNVFLNNYWGQEIETELEQGTKNNLKISPEIMVILLSLLILGFSSLTIMVIYKKYKKNHIHTLKEKPNKLTCPKCQEANKRFIEQMTDEKTILYQYPEVVYGIKYSCKRCGAQWRLKNEN